MSADRIARLLESFRTFWWGLATGVLIGAMIAIARPQWIEGAMPMLLMPFFWIIIGIGLLPEVIFHAFRRIRQLRGIWRRHG